MYKKNSTWVRFTIILIFAGLNLSCTPADKTAKIISLLNYCYENGMLNGSVLVAENAKIIYNKTFGYSDIATGEPLKDNSPFYLASVAKQFTTMAIMMLKEKGRLNYDDKITDYFPEFPAYANQVTIRHLMTHTSGIADHFALGAGKPDLTNLDVLNLLVRQDSLNFKPGEKYSYSNGGYVLLSLIVEKAAGVPFNEFLRDNIFIPLEMNYSLVYDQSKPKIPFRAIGFNMYGDKDDYNILTTGAGGIFSTSNDLFKWDQALYTEKLVKNETLNEAFTPTILNNDSISYYGFGWRIVKDNKRTMVVHSGGLAGYRTFIGRDLDKKNTIIILTSKGNAIQIGDITDAIDEIMAGNTYRLPRIPVALKMHQALQNKEIGEVIMEYDSLRKNHPDSFNFSEWQLNNLGYRLISEKRVGDAIEIFKLNVREYPDAYNTYDSLGEAYMLKRDLELAAENYNKSLELNPENKNAVRMLQQLKL